MQINRLIVISSCLIATWVIALSSASACSCLNGGKCVEDRCQCASQYAGPRCERTKLSFRLNSSFILHEKVPESENFFLSFRVIIKDMKGNGTLLSLFKDSSTTDKSTMIIGVFGGHPKLYISPNITLTLRDTKGININTWYKIHVVQYKSKMIFIREKHSDSISDEEKREEITLPTNSVFNMTGATVRLGYGNQFGGVAIENAEIGEMLKRSLLSACIADLSINGVLQNMNDSSETTTTCHDENSCSQCLDNTVCYGKLLDTTNADCECKIGFAKGNNKYKCNIEVSSYDMKQNGSVRWDKENEQITIQHLAYEIQFRTLKPNANVIYTTVSTNKNLFAKIAIENSIFSVEVEGEKHQVKNFNVSNGEWTTLRFRRHASIGQIFLENNHSFTYQTFIISKSLVNDKLTTDTAGYLVSEPDSSFEGCMKDVKIATGTVDSADYIMPLMNRTLNTTDGSTVSIANLNSYLKGIKSNGVAQNCGYTASDCQRIHPCRKDQKNIVRWRSCGCECANEDTFEWNNACAFKNVCQEIPCKNNGTCFWNGTSYEDRKFSCTCVSGYSGPTCVLFVTPPTSSPGTKGAGFIDQWWILLICLLLLLLLFLALFAFMKRRKRRDADAMKVLGERYDVDQVYENTGLDEADGGGEEDYRGDIDFSVFGNPPKENSAPIFAPALPFRTSQFDPKPLPFDWKNPDMENDDHLDHPLEYGYEGAGSNVTLSSIVSSSVDEDLDLNDIGNLGSKFQGLSELLSH